MKLIAHRGLFNGPDEHMENKPAQVELALSLGYDAEVDLRVYEDKFYLGHDFAQYQIDPSFLYKNRLWIHAKNFEALEWLSLTNLNYFWHENDAYTLTSKNLIWTYPEKILSPMSICVMPELYMEWEDIKDATKDCYGICSDYVSRLDF